MFPQTPMIKQYLEIKNQYPDSILFYRIGDFHEMFFEDAVKASKVLDIVLTTRNKNDPNPVPLCGVPYHSVQPYLDKLISQGLKVAICDQVEDPKEAKGVVKREVTRVVTPGLSEEQRLVTIHFGKEQYGLAELEMTTGEFWVMTVSGNSVSLQEELRRIRPSEIVIPEEKKEAFSDLFEGYCVSFLPPWIWNESTTRKILYEQFRVASLAGFQCEDIPEGIVAAGAALHYVCQTQKVEHLLHLRALKRYFPQQVMRLGEETRRNLDLDELISSLNDTRTSMGLRRFRQWFEEPLVEKKAIEDRLDAVEELVQKKPLALAIAKNLEEIYDLERINSRLSVGTAHARDLVALKISLEALKKIESLLSEFQGKVLKEISSSWNSFKSLSDQIGRTLVEDPPFSLKEGGLIREGMSPELDDLRQIQKNAKGVLAAIEERERQRTGIGSLKIHFNRVFGYYLEVSRTHLAKVPPDFIRKQTLANAERYITQELKELEEKILGAEGKIQALEYHLFCELRDKVLEEVAGLQAQASRCADLDAVLSLATYAVENETTRPVIEENGILEIRGGRHPLVEKSLPRGSYVPSDLKMDVGGDRLLLITGPNMAGKSTVIRQAGVIVLMAQVGSFVPAVRARIGLVDQLFTRVGASDRLARGESTFMVEMGETSAILHHATKKSLILLDEIGRGTSTFDGISIAWAVAEYLHDQIGARTLFATHYHELIDLARVRPGIKNYNVAIKEEGGGIVFLYQLVPGGMSHSYGLHVARLAGLPQPVLERAKEVLQNLEQGELDPAGTPRISKRRKSSSNQNQGESF